MERMIAFLEDLARIELRWLNDNFELWEDDEVWEQVDVETVYPTPPQEQN